MNLLTPLRKIIYTLMICSDKTKSYCRDDQNASLVDGKVGSIHSPSFFDAMGPITAREIFKRRLDKNIIAEMGTQEVRNLGRYQIVRMQEVNASIIHTLLVDKQKRMVVSLYRKDARLSDRCNV